MLSKRDCFLDLGRCNWGGDDWLDEEAVDLRDEVDRRSDAPCVLLRCFLPESTDLRCCPECVLRRGGFPWNFCTIADTLVLCFTAVVLLSSSLWGGRKTEGSLECFTPTSTAHLGEVPSSHHCCCCCYCRSNTWHCSVLPTVYEDWVSSLLQKRLMNHQPQFCA